MKHDPDMFMTNFDINPRTTNIEVITNRKMELHTQEREKKVFCVCDLVTGSICGHVSSQAEECFMYAAA